MKTIVMPLDGSPLAERVLPYARQLATLYEAEIKLVEVIPDVVPESLAMDAMSGVYGPVETTTARQSYWNARQQSAHDHAEGYLFSQSARLRGDGMRASSDVCGGAPAEVIVDAARAADTWITMATHGYSGLRRWALGSVADRVVHLSHAPVLLIRAAGDIIHDWSIKRILVPLDGSTYARQALPLAYDLADRTGAEVRLLEVLNPLLDAEVGWETLPRDFDARRLEDAESELQALAGEGRAQGLRVTPIATFGYPAEEIINEAATHNVDLVIMATHGRSGLRRMVLGSVADKVLHAGNAPLLLVRPTGG